MEIRISHSILRFLTETYLLLALVITMASSGGFAEAPSKGRTRGGPLPTQTTEWHNEVSAGVHFLHQLFSDVNPKSKMIILDNRDWGHSQGGLLAFMVYVCEPDSPPTEEQQRDILTAYNIHCSSLTMYADFLMGGSQLGRVPASVIIRRPALDKRWNELSAILLSHSEWSKTQVEDAMRKAGVKYGGDSHDEVLGPIHDSLKKLQPFLGKLIIDSIDYSPPNRPTDAKELLPPVWRVEAHPSGQDKKKPWTTYVLIFDAFDGAFESEQKSISKPH